MDPLLVELHHSILTPEGQGVSKAVYDALSVAKASANNVYSAMFKNNAHSVPQSSHVSY